MVPGDHMCVRSMVLEWEDGTGPKQKWISSKDPLHNGWYEVEKLLPPTVTNIKVQFKARGPRKSWNVRISDWSGDSLRDKADEGQQPLDVICFRDGEGHELDNVDAVFELKGLMHRCYISRAWNAG